MPEPEERAADCDQGRAGHPAMGVNRLLELLIDPDHLGQSMQCP